MWVQVKSANVFLSSTVKVPKVPMTQTVAELLTSRAAETQKFRHCDFSVENIKLPVAETFDTEPLFFFCSGSESKRQITNGVSPVCNEEATHDE